MIVTTTANFAVRSRAPDATGDALSPFPYADAVRMGQRREVAAFVN